VAADGDGVPHWVPRLGGCHNYSSHFLDRIEDFPGTLEIVSKIRRHQDTSCVVSLPQQKNIT
jgi:hypothetical protein